MRFTFFSLASALLVDDALDSVHSGNEICVALYHGVALFLNLLTFRCALFGKIVERGVF